MSWSEGKPLIDNKNLALVGGVIFTVIGVALLYDAYEGRGGKSPFWTKFMPGI